MKGFSFSKNMRKILCGIVAALCVAAIALFWQRKCSVTHIAFVNYQATTMGEISKANDNWFVSLHEIDPKNLSDDIADYDMVFVNGMGLRITAEQREALEMVSLTGTPVLTTMTTNPDNHIISVDSLQQETLTQYMMAGGRKNYRSMLSYVRKDIDRKLLSTDRAECVVPRPDGLLYHYDVQDREGENLYFKSVGDYESYLGRHGLLKPDGKRIIVSGQMGDATDLTIALEQRGYVVYLVTDINTFVAVTDVSFSAVINMAHGRLGDGLVDWLTQQNIPLFSPLNVNMLTREWLDDKQGMQGGFLSQSVIMPETDGAIRTYALFAQRENSEGIRELYAMPDRLETFVSTIDKYVALKEKRNADKRVAIVYFGNAEQNTITASGLEGVPSLYNLMRRLQQEGYDVRNLPQSVDRFRLSQSDYGNVLLLPQPMAGEGTDTFAIVHGTDQIPPQAFQDCYRRIHDDFKADALIHFGTHGGLEYTPRKQVALSGEDWPDKLIGDLPHFYIYTIGNVGEALIAKRRTYAGIQSHLTAPFMESNLRGTYKQLSDAIAAYGKSPSDTAAKTVQTLAVALGIHRDLRLPESAVWSEEDISRVEEFAEELVNEKITGELYTLGVPYSPERIESSVYAMATEPIAYSLLALDKLMKRTSYDTERHRSLFSQHYIEPARRLVAKLLADPSAASDALVCQTAHITMQQLAKAREVDSAMNAPKDMAAMMTMMKDSKSGKPGKNMDPREALKKARQMGAPPSALKKMARAMGLVGGSKDGSDKISGMMAQMAATHSHYTKEEQDMSRAIIEVVRTIENVGNYRTALLDAPEQEMASLINALNGGYTAPSTGGDVVSNPRTLPTGRNLFGINAEATPSARAWEQGKALAESTLAMYRRQHHDSLPRKLSYTLWSSEFVETGGATIAQILYMLGVEPVRDAFDRVTDLRLIPSKELGRSRIDVVVQTSGQLRDLAASRLYLINRAVSMAASAKDDVYYNQVTEGVLESEKYLTTQGVSPKEAREMSAYRVFGGVNGGYGTGIQGMVQSQDGWNDEGQIAEVYLNNMGAFYGTEEAWEQHSKTAFAAALTRTDAVVQPRQSNTWGALSLDHVYEFMGGMNLAVSHVTGRQPEAYLADYRNRNNHRMQDLKEAIGVESRTTIFNPTYIKERMKGGASAASSFAEVVENTYGWSVTRKHTIDNEMWDEIYDTYVNDKHSLGVAKFMKNQNPKALETLTTTMLKAAGKGYWKASSQQMQRLESLKNEALQLQRQFNDRNDDAQEGVVMKKETLSDADNVRTTIVSAAVVMAILVVSSLGIVVLVRRRRKQK